MKIRGFSNLIYVAELRYLQSLHEQPELENPDRLVGEFLPQLRRSRCRRLSQRRMAILRTDPLYYYLLARTKYYDAVFLNAITAQVQYIINVGCGTDTRAYRFENALTRNGVRVVECDILKAIQIKQSTAKRVGDCGHVTYVSIDLNDDTWPDFEDWLAKNHSAKAMVLMEGVSPYIHVETFSRFLRLLAETLPRGSRVAYDFKLAGVADEYGRVGRTQRPFRVGAGRENMAIFHEKLGYQLDHMEGSGELTTRLVGSVNVTHSPLFLEDALIQLEISR
jgi:methyltransferase (TIGR00027 family)